MVKLSIVIPAYNEEKIIENTIKTYIDFFDKKLKNDYEIVIIPNGCKDKTVEIVKNLSKKYKQIKHFDLGFPGSKGKAVLKGFGLAKGDLIGFVDADLSSPPKAFYDLVLNIKDYDGIIASRSMKGSKLLIKQPLLRRFLGYWFRFLVNLFLGLKYYDTQCGLKVFKKNAIKKIYQQVIILGWAFDINLLYLMKLNKFKVLEIPTEWSDSKTDSKLNVTSAVPEMFLSIIKLRVIHSPLKPILFNSKQKVHEKTR
mgnify:CR=1 FL=1